VCRWFNSALGHHQIKQLPHNVRGGNCCLCNSGVTVTGIQATFL